MKSLVLPEVEAYAEAHSVAESDICRRLREETYRTMECPPNGCGVVGRGVFESHGDECER